MKQYCCFFITLVVVVVLIKESNATTTRSSQKPELRFNSNGKFKIVQFTDMHFGDGYDKDKRTMEQQRMILALEKPDMVMVTGDSISGYSYPTNSSCLINGVAGCWKHTVSAMMEAQIPWAFIFGNHDDQGDLNRDQIMEIETSFPLSLTQRGPKHLSGVSNYVLSILSSGRGGNKSAPAVNLFMLDTGDDDCLGVKGWGCVYPDQVEWYRQTSKQMRENAGGAIVPALAFFHIASPEYMNVWNKYPVKGHKEETVCCFSVNTGIFAAFKEMGDVMSTYVGHDHNNDYYGDYHNITLTYGRKTGYGGYFSGSFLRGARVIELTEKPFSLRTWVRQEDGSIDWQTADTKKRNKRFGDSEPQFICGKSFGQEMHDD